MKLDFLERGLLLERTVVSKEARLETDAATIPSNRARTAGQNLRYQKAIKGPVTVLGQSNPQNNKSH